MNKPILFLDFDGLKFDTLNIHVEYINQKYAIQSIASDYTNNPRLETILKKYLPEDQHHMISSEEIYVDLGKNLNASLEWHENVPPLEGMTEILPLLAQKYSLWTVTARQKICQPVVEHLLERHVPNCITGIHFVWEHLGNNQFKGISKKEFVANFEGEKIAFIDDSATEILRMQDIIPSYLFDPDGLNDDLTEIKNRVRSWKEIGEIFL